MCRNVRKMPNGVLVACRKCWQCRENAINDWVGRCIAESKTSVACHSISLTYGRDEQDNPDHVRAAVLTYSDVQKYVKRLRAAGYPLRYFVVGEYGGRKGRSHWHLIAFWQERVPPHVLRTEFVNDDFWAEEGTDGVKRPIGYVYWDDANEAAVRYVCKYIQKDVKDAEAQGHLSMSKKPPLGDEWFRQLAARMVASGLGPRDLFYSHPECRDRKGRLRKFLMAGKTADNFLRYWVDEWKRVRPGQEMPNSELVEEWLDEQVAKSPALSIVRSTLYGKPEGAQLGHFEAAQVSFSDVHGAWYARDKSGAVWWYIENEKGQFVWRNGHVLERASASAIDRFLHRPRDKKGH